MNKYTDKKIIIDNHEEQKRLHKKYDVQDNVIIKESPNMTKFFVKYLVGATKLLISILITILVAVGIIALSYSNVRYELLFVVKSAFESLR